MAYYHVSTKAKDGQIYFINQKPLQKYIDHFEAFPVENYLQFANACNMIPDAIVQETDIRKSKWLCELIFENVRRKNFNWAPRRQHSVYLCGSFREASLFNEEFRENKASIFEAIFDGVAHQFNMDIFTCAEEYLFSHITDLSEAVYEYLVSCAFEYWKQRPPMERIEYIYEGTVELRRVFTG